MRAAKNPWIGVNYIGDSVRMPAPPAFWLQRLYDFDADLVVLPSRMIPFAYVLARRARLTAGITSKAIVDACGQQDTVMCFDHKLVPVTMIYRTGTTWSIDNIIAGLKARDIWAQGGADKVADTLEAKERAEKKRLKQSIRDDMWNRSGDAYRSYKMRSGEAVALTGSPTLPSQTGTANVNRASRSTAGSGIILASS